MEGNAVQEHYLTDAGARMANRSCASDKQTCPIGFLIDYLRLLGAEQLLGLSRIS